MSNSFVFYESFLEVIEKLPSKKQKDALMGAIIDYGLHGIEHSLEFPLDMAFIPIKCSIDSSKSRYTACVENGRRGGRPRAENGQKSGAEKPKEKPVGKPKGKPEQKPKAKPKENLNYNDNYNYHDNENDNDNYNLLTKGEVGGETLEASPPPSGHWEGDAYLIGDRLCRDYRTDEGELRTVAYGQQNE